MAALVASSNPSLFSQNPRFRKNLRLFSPKPSLSLKPHRLFFPRNPRPSDSASREDHRKPKPKAQPIADEWGEKSEPEPEPASTPDPPRDEDEWGNDTSSSANTQIADEWGEKADPEAKPAGVPDPPRDDDEWGPEGEGAASGDLAGNGSAAGEPESNREKLEDLKRCLVDTVYGTDYGLRASGEVRAEIFELVSQLEAENPTPAPNEAAELLDGNWILLYTAFSELLPLVAIGATPLLKVKKISQAIDTKSMKIINAVTLSSPFATFSFSATASFEVRSPTRIQVKFTEGSFQPPDISSTVNLPENVEIFGQKISLSPVQQSLTPLQEAVASIARFISGQPPLKVSIPGDRTSSWLLTTYLDEDLRISRGDGGLFVLAKEGSPLLDQLS